MLMKSLLAMALGGVAAWHLTAQRQDRLDRERKRSQAKPVEENTWENEGGALPVGPQLAPVVKGA